jgi:hypothetical protein
MLIALVFWFSFFDMFLSGTRSVWLGAVAVGAAWLLAEAVYAIGVQLYLKHGRDIGDAKR